MGNTFPVFRYVEIDQENCKFKIYMKPSRHYLASFNDSEEAIRAAQAVDRTLLEKHYESKIQE